MTKITAILFILGFSCAPFAFLFLVPLVLFFTSDYPWESIPNTSFLALVGFWVWFGWGWHCLTGQFPLVSPRQFWMISLATHLLWAAVGFGGMWVIVNVIVAILALLYESGYPVWQHEKLLQTVAYGLPLAIAASAVGDVRNIGPSAFFLLVAVVALLVAAWRPQQPSDESMGA